MVGTCVSHSGDVGVLSLRAHSGDICVLSLRSSQWWGYRCGIIKRLTVGRHVCCH